MRKFRVVEKLFDYKLSENSVMGGERDHPSKCAHALEINLRLPRWDTALRVYNPVHVDKYGECTECRNYSLRDIYAILGKSAESIKQFDACFQNGRRAYYQKWKDEVFTLARIEVVEDA